jgi:hypothetical protein
MRIGLKFGHVAIFNRNQKLAGVEAILVIVTRPRDAVKCRNG